MIRRSPWLTASPRRLHLQIATGSGALERATDGSGERQLHESRHESSGKVSQCKGMRAKVVRDGPGGDRRERYVPSMRHPIFSLM